MPRPVNHALKDRIMSLGREYVQSHGYHACSVQDIAVAAKIPKGSFYSYFDSKEAFAIQIIYSYWEEIIKLDSAGSSDGSKVSNHFNSLIKYHEQNGYVRGCLLGNLALELSGTNDLVRNCLLEIFEQWENLIAAKLSVELPSKSTTELDEIAESLISGFEGAVLQAKLFRNSKPFDRFKQNFLKSVLV